MPKRISTFIVCFFLFSFLTKGQPLQYQFSQLNISNGLSHNQVNSILKDRKGFMWFATMSGLNRYDGYVFKVFKHILRDSTSLNDDNVLNIQEGPYGKLWVQTRIGYVIYDPVKENFDRHPERFLKTADMDGAITDIRGDGKGSFWIITTAGLYRFGETEKKALRVSRTPTGISSTSLCLNSAGDAWVVYNNGLAEQVSGKTNKLTYRIKITGSSETASYRIFADNENDVWIYSTDRPKGIYYINASKTVKEHYTKGDTRLKLNTNNIYSISQDNKGIIWIGTDHGGINLFDKKDRKVSYLLNRETDEKSLAQNSTLVVYKDSSGIMWIGTFKRGLSYYHESIIKFPIYRHRPGDPNSLCYEDVNRFVEDARGNLWIGTNGGGLIYFNRQKNSFTRFIHNPENDNSLSNDVIVSLWIDHEHKLWIGTYFGGLDCYDGNKFIHYKHNDDNASSLSDDRVWEIMEDSGHNLWVGTLAGGLDLFDRATGMFKHYRGRFPNSIQSNYIAALLEDKAGNVWIGTDNGIDVWLKQSGKFKHYSHAENDPQSLSNDNVLSLLQDSHGRIWAGTQDGLNVFYQAAGRFGVFRVSDGLPDNTILTLLEDNRQQIWLSTPNGISNITVNEKGNAYTCSFRNYDELDGLQGREFNENAALKTRKGELIFGGSNGFNLFNPDNIKTNKQAPSVVLTGFQLFNQSLAPGEVTDGNVILKNSITETHEVKLNYDQNVFSIEFAALNFSNAAKNKYSYMLEGFNSQWLTTDGKNRKATFTNLDPGEYIFRVRASNDNGIWNNEGIALKIEILPPFWKTPLACALYIIVVLALLFYIRRRGIQKLKTQFAIEQERQTAHRMHELDIMKIKFFTNVSHEFRTPLSLILSPLDKLLRNAVDSNEKYHLQLVQRNARRLLNLVNQLMDFRKMEENQLNLQPEEGDIIEFIKDSFQSFTDLAEKKNINFDFRSELNSLITNFDHDKIERILFNLLSNAFKFTSEGGSVFLEVCLKTVDAESDILRIIIKDSGIGISPDKQEKIFERFFQSEVPGSMVNQGSGIGLAITREFVNLHGGTISVESEPDKGSCFIVELPVKAMKVAAEGIYMEEAGVSDGELLTDAVPGDEKVPGNQKKQSILLIEDNEDFRFYLKDNLKEHYQIAEASNGKTGWSKALADHPDLIVSDISMPEMNGIDLCLKIRNDKRTSHIPVILLTAMTGEEQLLRGLETGASDYMTKPFNFEVLISKIKNLLIQQESLRKTYQRQVEVKPSNVELVSSDEKFIQQALLIIEKNISNSEFSVEEFSREMAMSRVALYKKLLQLTRKTPIEFIRTIRLKRAVQLLEKSQLTVAEVAYEVGFNNPKYFAKYFKFEFGVLPSLWSKQRKNTTSDEIPD